MKVNNISFNGNIRIVGCGTKAIKKAIQENKAFQGFVSGTDNLLVSVDKRMATQQEIYRGRDEELYKISVKKASDGTTFWGRFMDFFTPYAKLSRDYHSEATTLILLSRSELLKRKIFGKILANN